MERKQILLPALALACCTQGVQADEIKSDAAIQDGVYLIQNGILTRQPDATLRPAIAPTVQVGGASIDVKLLGETIANTTLVNKRRLERAARKDAKEAWLKDHPKLAVAQKYSGFLMLDHYVLTPYSDWIEDRQGLAMGLNTTANVANTLLLAGGAARGK